jgi:Tol biopolymer transport system component
MSCVFAVLALLCALRSSAAWAGSTPPVLVSDSGSLEADDAYSPAISADGEYVAFVGDFDGVSGVYRKDLATGELALVAGLDSADPALSAPDAGAPSISAEGRYVSFTSAAVLGDAAEDPAGGCSSVYVRDMDVPIEAPGAYTLASALNATAEGIAYAGSTAAGGGCPGGGSAAADRVALSADGREVAFTVLGGSDLTTGAGGATNTPPDQVAVRNLETDTTTLVSQTMSSLGSTPEAVPGGAALGNVGGGLRDIGDGRELSGSTAAISADGSTVAWMGIDIPAQAPASAGDAGAHPDEYDEPLWRRIADGPDAPTRRITGGDDPIGCPGGCAGPLDTAFDPNYSNGNSGPEFGTYVAPNGFSRDPLIGLGSLESVTPQLSADGQLVAILSTQPLTGEVSAGLAEELDTSTANAYVVNMASGLSRTQALTRVTEWASYAFSNIASTGAIDGIAISPDGTRVAFTTARIDFPLAPPALVTPALGQAGDAQLYVADLSAGTLALVSYGYDDEPANGTIATPSFAGDGEALAFASSATNLVYGAYDEGASGIPSNVFVTSQISSPAIAGEAFASAPPADPLVPPRWELLATASPGPDGSVLLYVTVPGAGSLNASASAKVQLATAASSTRAKAKVKRTTKGAQAAAARRSTRVGKATSAKRATVVARTVASAKKSIVTAGAKVVELRLTSARAYRSLVESHDGLYATIALTFKAKGRSTLRDSLQATFHGAVPKKPVAKQRSKTAEPPQ